MNNLVLIWFVTSSSISMAQISFLPPVPAQQNIRDLDPNLPLNKIPSGTEISMLLPAEIINEPLPFLGGELYGVEIEFNQGQAVIKKRGQYEDQSQIRNNSGKPMTPTCTMDVSQYSSSPPVILKKPEVSVVVQDSSRVTEYSVFTKTVKKVVLDTAVEGEKFYDFSAIDCEGGWLSGHFSDVTVGQLIKTLGNYLAGPPQKQ